MKQIEGGVCAAKGFTAAGVHCGIRKNRSKKDLALIYSAVPAAAAAVYTTNLVKGAPLAVTKAHLQNGRAQAVICNSGNANTCNANGVEIAEQTCALAAGALGIAPEDVVVASTGVIGQPLDIAPIAAGIPPLCAALSADGGDDAAEGILTTDTVKKEAAVEFTLGGKVCRIGGMAKGSGMIHPNMATMLVFLTTDAAVSPAMLQRVLSADAADTFNMISIDGDTSTNDMVTVLANGMAGNAEITAEGEDCAAFAAALNAVTTALCRAIAGDGEGATKLLECRVDGAPDTATAKTVAKSVICSSLLKAAMFGADANWGRVLCAIGYSGAAVDVDRIDVAFTSAAGTVRVCRGGAGVDFSEEKAKEILLCGEIGILVSLNAGEASATAWGCDLTYDYVRINGDYRT
ncbi:MAG: bifunctional glutamate N-acetyltransferase/amino-acid acetyltransferase ArgJ [Oscillospiraceae bacterium]|nr:bifunctional glutamate N-acetyltransferase/amino-acid acetyltransferase ArgJ [Oscillospiraceae bacterium]